MAEKRFGYRYATEEELEEMKQREFAGWMFTYVSALNKLKYHLSHIYTILSHIYTNSLYMCY